MTPAKYEVRRHQQRQHSAFCITVNGPPHRRTHVVPAPQGILSTGAIHFPNVYDTATLYALMYCILLAALLCCPTETVYAQTA